MRRAIVTGGSSGLGAEIVKALGLSYAGFGGDWSVNNWSKNSMVDLESPSSIKAAADYAKHTWLGGMNLDLLVNCAGINKINYIPNVSVDEYDEVMNVNVRAIFLCSQAFLDELRGGTIINIVSNASHVPMTSSLAYNASKGAAAIMTRQMARELKKTHDITVFSISPNKMFGTGMSKDIDEQVCKLRGWTPEQASAYQLAALPAGEETDPVVVAEFIAFLMSSKERHKYLNGCDIPYGT